jgi:SAM-dependent methyltransferase
MAKDGGVESRRIVAAGYDAAAGRYAALEAPEAPWPRVARLRDLLERLPAGAAVLDVGCGNGLPALREIARDHRATGVEISAVQADLARQNVPDATVTHGDLSEVEFPPASFEAITALYVIDHLPRREHSAVFEQFHRWLRHGGYLLFMVEPYDEPGDVREWEGVPMFFSQFDPATTLSLVAKAGFGLISHDVQTQLEGGREVEFLWVLAQKP